jgi:chitodextrinase
MAANGLRGRAVPGLICAHLLALTLVVMAPAASAAPRDRTPPTTPTNLRVVGTTASSVSLAWNASTDNRGVERLRYIVVDSRGFGTLVWHPTTSVTITSLTPGSMYSFHVYAEDAAWNRSGNSNTVTATLPLDTTPPTAPVLSVLGVTPSQVWLKWTASTDDITFGIAGYRVFVDGAPATNLVWHGELQVALRHLTPDTSYTFRVEARDRSGNVATSNTVPATTAESADTEAPTSPTNLRHVSEHGDCEVVLAWDQSTDNMDPQNAIEYEFYLNGVLNDLAIGIGQMLTYGLRGAESSTFTLRAVDRSGNTSPPGNELTLIISGC